MAVTSVALFLAKTAFTVAAGAAVGSLFSRDSRRLQDDSVPATLAEQGSRVQLLVGRDRLAPVFAYESENARRVREEPIGSGGSGKGFGGAAGGQRVQVYYSAGQHLVGVGPAWRLFRIWENGERIWPFPGGPGDGPGAVGITPLTHPSGSELEVLPTPEGNSRGRFRIYWGEPDQPNDVFLSQAGELGVDSNFGYICHIVWIDRRLGGAGVWPELQYGIEFRPFNPGQLYNGGAADDYDNLPTELPGTPAWLENGTVVDRNQCFEILRIEEDPGNRILIPDVGQLFDFAGETIFIEGTPSGFLDGFLEATAFTPGPSVPFPQGPFIDRELAIDPSDYGRVNANIVNTFDAATNPTGILISSSFGGNGNPGTPRNVRFRLQRNAAGNAFALPQMERIFNQVLNDPDPGAGNSNQFNPGFHYIECLIRRPVTGSVTVSVGMSADPVNVLNRGARLTIDATGVIFQESLNGGEFTVSNLDNSWVRLQVAFSPALAAGVTATTNLQPFFRVDAASANNNAEFVVGNGASGFPSILNYRELTAQNTIFVELDAQVAQSFDGVSQELGEMCRIVPSERGPQGANGAHLLFQLMFQTQPHGLGLDVGCFDIASLQTVANQVIQQRSHTHLQGNSTVEAGIQALLTELGIVIAWDYQSGLWTFKALREEAPLLTVPRDALVGPIFDVQGNTGEVQAQTYGFTYRDETRGFREGFVPGEDTSFDTPDIRRQTIRTSRDREAATTIARRLELTESSNPRLRTQRISRESLELRIGDTITLPDNDDILKWRILTMRPSQDLPEVLFELASDSFTRDDEPFSFANVSGVGNNDFSEDIDGLVLVPADLDERVYEMSLYLTDQIQLALLRRPGSAEARFAQLSSSSDNVNFTILGGESAISTGFLAESFGTDFSDDGYRTHYIEDGPVIKADDESFRVDTVELTEAAWRSGNQLMIIGDELLYVREFIALGGNLYQASGVLRGRLDSRLQNHAANDSVFVFGNTELNVFGVPSSGRGIEVYLKAIPRIGPVFADPSNTTSIPYTPTGKAIRPAQVEALRLANMSSCIALGQPALIKWAGRDPNALRSRTGFGMQGFGEVTSDGEFPGTFSIAVVNAVNGNQVEPLQTGLTLPQYQYTAAETNMWPADVQIIVLAVYDNGETSDRAVLDLAVV